MTPSLDQAARLRALVDEQWRGHHAAPEQVGGPRPGGAGRRRAHVFAVASGKGGVGKTSLAVNLAIAFARAGMDTVLLDGDLGLGNADMMFGLPPGKHLGSVLRGERSLEEIALRVMERLTLVPCGSGVSDLADLDPGGRGRLMRAFGALEDAADVVLMDCGAGVGGCVLDLVASADTTIIVTTPEPTAVADAYGLLKSAMAREPRPAAGAFQLVVNQCRSRGEGSSVHARMAAVSDRFLGYPLQLAGTVLADNRVGQAVRARTPLLVSYPRSDAARDVQNLSGCLMRLLGDSRGAPAPRGGLLSKLWRVATHTT